MGSRVVPTTATPDHVGLIQTTALVVRPSDQSIVMSAGKQKRQASKQENEQCRSNPPKGVPQANFHNTWALVSQGGHLWPIANWEQSHATHIRASPPLAPTVQRAKRGTVWPFERLEHWWLGSAPKLGCDGAVTAQK